MKKLLYILASAAMLLNSSCSDMLEAETQSSFDDSVVFSNYTLAEYNIYSIYQTFMQDKSYRNRYHIWYGFNTDIEWYNSSDPTSGKVRVAGYDVPLNESQAKLDEANGIFSWMYTAIERCNLCIEGIRQYGNPAANSDMAYLLGEALTLRAMVYFDLTKAWGDVPARFSSISSETIYLPKSDRDEIYAQCIADLQEAAGYLYWPNEQPVTTLTTRVNKAFAKGLLARFCLTAAGYALRPAEGQIGTGDAGSVRRSSRTEAGGEWAGDVLYDMALKACQDVIAQEGKSVGLAADFKQIWKDMMAYQNTVAGGETLFAIPYGHESALRGQWNTQFAILHGAANNYVEKSRGGAAGPVPSMYWEYDEGDQRRDASCVNYEFRAVKNGEFLKDFVNINKPTPSGISKWYFGKFRYEWMNVRISGDDGIKPMVLRYSDILLMAAECANEMNDLNTAKGYLKQVRQRAFGTNTAAVEAYMNGITSKDAMFKAIFAERALEFCGEMLRKQDLIRWGLLGDAMDDTVAKLQALRTKTDYTSPITGRTYPFSQIGSELYFRLTANDMELQMYGLNPGETAVPAGDGWVHWGEYNDLGEAKHDYIKESKITDERIAGLMFLDPDTRQYWPIFASMLSSTPMLKNDYGY